MSLIFTNFGWGSIQQFGLKGTTVIIYFILARLLGAEAIGLISFAYASAKEIGEGEQVFTVFLITFKTWISYEIRRAIKNT